MRKFMFEVLDWTRYFVAAAIIALGATVIGLNLVEFLETL